MAVQKHLSSLADRFQGTDRQPHGDAGGRDLADRLNLERIVGLCARTFRVPMAAVHWMGGQGREIYAAHGAATDAAWGHLGHLAEVTADRGELIWIPAITAPPDPPVNGSGKHGGALFFFGGIPLPVRGDADFAVLSIGDVIARRDFVDSDAEALADFAHIAAACLGQEGARVALPFPDAPGEGGFVQFLGDAVPLLLSYCDTDFNLRYTNRPFRDVLGRAPVPGTSLQEVLGTDAFEENAHFLNRARNGEVVRSRISMPDATGFKTVFDVTHIPYTDGNGSVNGVLSVAEDVGGEARFEACLRDMSGTACLSGVGLVQKTEGLLRLAREYFDMEHAFVTGVDGERCTILFSVSESRDFRPGHTCLLDQTYCATAIDAGDVYAFENVNVAVLPPLREKMQPNCKSLISMPIYVDNLLFGAVTIASDAPRTRYFSERDRNVMRILAGIVGYETSRHERINEINQSNQKLMRLTIKDPLTGALNRREFMRNGHLELARAKRHERALSMLIIDINGLKRINEQFGHAVGDRVMVETSQILTGALRGSDRVGRLGGDEFGLLLPEIARHGAAAVSNRIADFFASNAIVVQGQPISVTIGIGISSLDESTHTLDDLIQDGYEALTRAKAKGPNSAA